MTSRTIISTPGAPAAIGPYSQAVKVNGLVYTAGVIPLDPDTKDIVGTDIRDQANRVLTSLQALLEGAGSSIPQVIKTTCFLIDMDDFPIFNEVYSTFFEGDEPPARSTIQVARLPMDVLVEIECVAIAD